MTMQHLKNEVPGLLESEPFCRIEFNFQISMSGTVTIHMADCGTATTIGGLKEDLKSLFGAPSVQEWYLRSTMLTDDRTLESYGIDGKERRTAKIYVKQTSH